MGSQEMGQREHWGAVEVERSGGEQRRAVPPPRASGWLNHGIIIPWLNFVIASFFILRNSALRCVARVGHWAGWGWLGMAGDGWGWLGMAGEGRGR